MKKSEPSLTTRPISTMLYRDEEGPKGIHHYVIRSGQMPAVAPRGWGAGHAFVLGLVSWLPIVLGLSVLAIDALEAAPCSQEE